MYGWGPTTSNWKKPGAYKYDSARSPYLDKLASAAASKGPRSYARSGKPNMGLVDPMGKTISSDSKNPLVIAVDVTGSMSEWPGQIFDRLPLLYQTLSQYREDLEVSFGAIGDANSDQYPLQVNDFAKGLELEEKLKALGCEGGGGGQVSETYELFGYFIQEHCKTPNATSPFLLIFGDEKFYGEVNPRHVKALIGDKMQGEMDSKQVLKNLMQRFNLYYLQKPYGHGEPDTTREVKEYWQDAIGAERVIDLPSMDRAVDVAMGIVSKYWGQMDDFDKSLSARQTDPSVRKSVYASLRHIPDKGSAKSVVLSSGKSRMTKSLNALVKKTD